MKRTATSRPTSSAGAPVDVLVIDDEASIREGCLQALEEMGYHTAVAEDGARGLEVLEELHPRVVLLDLRMPGVSGIEVLERLPGIDPRIIPIVITGYGTLDTAVTSMKLGAVDFLNKPFDPDQLLGVVERALRQHAAFEAVPEVVQATPPVEPRPKGREDLLLDGLETMGEAYALGERDGAFARELRALEAEAVQHARQLGQVRERERAIRELTADLRQVDQVIARHGFKRSALIQVLLDLQAEKHWLPRHDLMWISRRLGIPMARILEVVHFYEAFSLEPQGEHLVQVCSGTACHVRRAPELRATVSALLGIQPGETDPEGRVTLKQVGCLGCCALAPVLKVDDTTYSNPSLRELRAIFATASERRPAARKQEKEARSCRG